MLALGSLYLFGCSDEDPEEIEVYDPPEPKKDDGRNNSTDTGASTGQDTSDDQIDQSCTGIGATCVINHADCREMKGTVDEGHDCISGVCCIVEVTATDPDGVCDGKCISYSECTGPGYVGWEVVMNGTCNQTSGKGTVCCVQSVLPATDTGALPTDTALGHPTDTGTGDPVAEDAGTATDTGAAQDTGTPAGGCPGQCMPAVDCVTAGGEPDLTVSCAGTAVCCIL